MSPPVEGPDPGTIGLSVSFKDPADVDALAAVLAAGGAEVIHRTKPRSNGGERNLLYLTVKLPERGP